MPRVLLLLPTTTYRSQAFMEAAGRLGVEVTVGSEERSTMTGLNPTGFLTLDFSNPDRTAEQVAEFVAAQPIAAVVPVDDQVTAVGAAICQRLGLASNSVESARAARDKHRMRELLDRAGVPQPEFRLCPFTDEPRDLAHRVAFPCVVKPISLAASQGVIRANNPEEFVQAVARLAAILQNEGGERRAEGEGPEGCTGENGAVKNHAAFSGPPPSALRPAHGSFLVERFIGGPEVAVEGLLTRGRLRVLAIFDKPDPLDGPFFEETIYITPSRQPVEVQQKIAAVTADACRALGLVHGPVHAELRLKSGARGQGSGVRGQKPQDSAHSPLTTHHSLLPYVIEINPRSIGGLCSRVLRFGMGLSLEELIIRHAIDENYTPPAREGLAAGVMMIPIPRAGTLLGIRGLEAAKAVPGIEDVSISTHIGQRLVPLPEGAIYLGFIFARGSSPESVEAPLRAAHQRLDFLIDA